MEVQSRVGVPFSTGRLETVVKPIQPPSDKAQVLKTQKIKLIAKSRESRLDLLSASVVYGLTAFFMAFMFGYVTECISRISINILLSTFMGLCVGLITYELMKSDN